MKAIPISFVLSSAQLRWRAAFLIVGTLGALGLAAIDPASVPAIPFRTSCGAATGLPCIFCGATRALHHLLNGDFAQALYFNWLAFPVAALALAAAGKVAAELIFGCGLPLALPAFRLTPRVAALGAAGIAGLWLFQVALAVTLQKHELLNPDGLLYALIIR